MESESSPPMSVSEKPTKHTESPHHPSLSHEELRAIDRDADKFCAQFKRRHAAAIARNAVRVKHRLLRRVRDGFVLKRGPKRDPQIIEAHRMLRQGVKRRELIPRLVDGFKTLAPYGPSLSRTGP